MAFSGELSLTLILWENIQRSSHHSFGLTVETKLVNAVMLPVKEEEEDYLTCGKCMTEFRLDKITSFIKHKKQDCMEPGQELTNNLQAELVCSSCPQGFMTAVGLLKHAQTIHKFKLFLEKSANITGIEGVQVSPMDDTGQITIQNTVLKNFNSSTGQSVTPLVKEWNNEQAIVSNVTEKVIVPRQQISSIPKPNHIQTVNSEDKTLPISKLNPLEVPKSTHKQTPLQIKSNYQTNTNSEQKTLQTANQLHAQNSEPGKILKSSDPQNLNSKQRISQVSKSIQPESFKLEKGTPLVSKSNQQGILYITKSSQCQSSGNSQNSQLPIAKHAPNLPQPGSFELSMAKHDKSTPVKSDNAESSLSSSPQKNLSDSILNAIMKSGVIFPVMNKQTLNVPVSKDPEKAEGLKLLPNMQQTKQANGQLANIQLLDPIAGNPSGWTHTEGQITAQKPSLTVEQVSVSTVDCVEMADKRILSLPVKNVTSPGNKSFTISSGLPILSTGTTDATTSLKPAMTCSSNHKEMDKNIDSQFNTETKGIAINVTDNSDKLDTENSNDSSLLESSEIGCCDSQKCGVTVIPGTHEGLKECCNAVLPKKRKRHFETKHMLSARHKLSKRLSASDLRSKYRNVDNAKSNSGTIFIDLEPNDDGTLSQKSGTSGPFSTDDSEIGFQVSGLCRESKSSLQGKPKGKGSVILQPGAIFSIPIAYSLTTQTDGSLRPLVISKRTFQSEPTSVITSTNKSHNSKNVSETYTVISEEDLCTSIQENLSDRNTESLNTGAAVDLTSQNESINQSRRRRYPTSRPFKCDKCDSAFNQRIHLKKHMSKHTGEKPFKCQQCNYSTVERSHLKVHIRIHTGEKPFKCTYCEYATAQNSTLKIHLKRHHKPTQVSKTVS